MTHIARSATIKSILVISFFLCLMLVIGWQRRVSLPAITLAASAATPVQGDPSVVGWWDPTIFAWPVVAIHAHLLPNGQVLAWQRKDTDLTTQTYVWDPATPNTFTPFLNPNTSLFCSGHAFLPDGRLLVAGGHHYNDGVGEPHTNLFDSTTNTWTRVADMNAGRWYPTTTTLGTGEILVVSGNIDGTLGVNKLPQLYQLQGGWVSLNGAVVGMRLYPWMLLAPNGKVFNPGPDKETYFLDPSGAGSWSAGPISNFGLRDTGSAVMYDDGKVLIVGGGQTPPTNTAEVIDLNAPSPAWRYVGAMASGRRQMNATLLPDGKVLVTGGTSGSGANNAVGSVYAAEMWDPATEVWSTMASMQVRRIYHSTAVLLPDGRVLSAGGGMPAGSGGDTDHPDAEIYYPPYLFKCARPTITSAPTSVNYSQTFPVYTPDASSISRVTLIRLPSVTHTFNQNQRINRLSFTSDPLNGRLNVTAPASGNLCPPGHYMLFILNSNGVPSVAKVIQITGTWISPTSVSGVVNNGATGNVTVTVTSANSNWTAVSNATWITVTAGSSGSGNGTVTYSVASNLTGARRTGTLTIAGQTFTLTQESDFTDVPPTYPLYTYINKIFQRGISAGCASGLYCPGSPITREQMAIFIIRALHEPGYVPPMPATQRFQDVSPARIGYAFIDELAQRGITSGCGDGLSFCPDSPITREQTAIFIIRALHEPGYVPPTPATQRFQDVSPARVGYAFIDEFAQRGITSGCDSVNYCPDLTTTRGQMAVFLVRAFGL